MISSTGFNTFIFITFITNLICIYGQHISNAKCDETFLNKHMVQCYKHHIDQNLDTKSDQMDYFMDGSHLCQAYNKSSSYRQCLYSIFDRNDKCSSDKYQYSFEYFKIYWKLILSSCQVENNDDCLPSPLSQQILTQCHYSFNDKFPTKCKQFLRSVKCLEKHLIDLIPSKYGSTCSIDQAYYYFYGDLAARLQLAINLCEIK